jgi:hypothetical protein
LREEGHTNICDEYGNEVMDISEEKSNNSPLTEQLNDDIEMEAIQEKESQKLYGV